MGHNLINHRCHFNSIYTAFFKLSGLAKKSLHYYFTSINISNLTHFAAKDRILSFLWLSITLPGICTLCYCKHSDTGNSYISWFHFSGIYFQEYRMVGLHNVSILRSLRNLQTALHRSCTTLHFCCNGWRDIILLYILTSTFYLFFSIFVW